MDDPELELSVLLAEETVVPFEVVLLVVGSEEAEVDGLVP